MNFNKIIKKIVASKNFNTNNHKIQINCFYDTELSGMYFHENFKSYENNVVVYSDKEQDSEDIFTIQDVEAVCNSFDTVIDYKDQAFNYIPQDIVFQQIKKDNIDNINKKCIEQQFDYYDFQSIDQFINTINKQRYSWNVIIPLLSDNIVNNILEISKKYISIPSLQQLSKNIKYYHYDFNEMGYGFKNGWTVYTSRGYSQGDIAYVICKNNDNFNLIDNLLWDSPVYCKITIDGKEYDIDSYMNNNYDYDKKQIINISKNIIQNYDEQIDELLKQALPQIPYYL